MSDLRKREAKFKLGNQWYYRGNVSPAWLSCASRLDGSMCGIAEKVPEIDWQHFEAIAHLVDECVAAERARCVAVCRRISADHYARSKESLGEWFKASTATATECAEAIEKGDIPEVLK